MQGTILVTGSMGHVGSELGERVKLGGLNVRSLVRSEAQANNAKRRGWTPVFGDLTKSESLTCALDGVDFVLHCAAYLGPDLSTARAVNVEGTRLLAELSRRARVKRFVHISTLSVHGDPLPEVLDESSALATDDPTPYCSTKALGELALREVSDDGLDTVILRPGMICNVLRSQWGNEMIERIRNLGWPDDVHPDDVMPWVHTSNLADMSWLALTHPAAVNETFIAVDQNVAFSDFLVPIANALGQPVIPPKRAPIPTMCRLGKIATMLGYRPIHSFEETVGVLVQMARVSRNTHEN